jgi:hypothetical protein
VADIAISEFCTFHDAKMMTNASRRSSGGIRQSVKIPNRTRVQIGSPSIVKDGWLDRTEGLNYPGRFLLGLPYGGVGRAERIGASGRTFMLCLAV